MIFLDHSFIFTASIKVTINPMPGWVLRMIHLQLCIKYLNETLMSPRLVADCRRQTSL